MNFKQKELIRDFFNAIKDKFSEAEFISVTESPEDPADLWINIKSLNDENREEELISYACDKTTDMLLSYGYYISIMTRKITDGIGGIKYQEIFQ